MQTFLPYADFKKSAQCLDNRRLGKQRIEAHQIWTIVSGGRTTGGWVHHPAVLMWQGFPNALAHYYNEVLVEWVSRGFVNNMLPLTEGRLMRPHPMPIWFGDQAFHDSHRSNLLRKDIDFYSLHDWEVRPGLDYVWPI
jgi:hypothetical protein